MKEVRFFYVPDAGQQTELPAEEAMHAVRVLRLKEGDEMFLMDGAGSFYRAKVTVAASHHCYYEVGENLAGTSMEGTSSFGNRSNKDDGTNGMDG